LKMVVYLWSEYGTRLLIKHFMFFMFNE
jgi:hypothetical protein